MSEASGSTGRSRAELTESDRRALLLHLGVVVFRICVAILLVFAVYALMPVEEGEWSWSSIPLMLLGLALYGVIFYRQVRKVTKADYPVMRAVEALVFLILLFLVLFAAAAVELEGQQPGSFSESIDKVDGFYFAVTTLATVGYGDITPVSTSARVVVTIQMLGNLALLGVAVRAIGEAVRRGKQTGHGLVWHPTEEGRPAAEG